MAGNTKNVHYHHNGNNLYNHKSDTIIFLIKRTNI